MPISLQKGQKVDLTKGNPSLKHVLVGLGWDVNKYDGGAEFDLDAGCKWAGSQHRRICILRQSQAPVWRS